MEFIRICKALYKYEAVEEGEVSFEEEELLYILDDSNEDWWKASLEMSTTNPDKVGLIPHNYIEEVDYISKYRAIYAYEAQGEDELSFEEEVEMLVYQIEGEDWMLACIDGRFGFVPQSYAEEIVDNSVDQNNYNEEEYVEEQYKTTNTYVEPTNPEPATSTPLSTKKIVKDDMVFWRVSEVDKKKKKKKMVRLGISSDTIFVASEEEKGSPVKQWPITDLTSYSLKNKHIIIDLTGSDSITFDFSCNSIKQAEAVAYKIKSCSDATYKEKEGSKGSKGFLGMFKKSSKSSAPPKSLRSTDSYTRTEENQTSIKEKYETVPLPPIPQEEVDRASEEQKQYYPEKRTQIRSPIVNQIVSTSIENTNESKRGKPATVIYDFEAAEEGELAVQADTKIYIIDSESDTEWWKCRIYKNDDEYDEGFVPAEYITLLPLEVSQHISKAKNNVQELNPNLVREWTDTTGSFKVEAEFIKFSEGKIHLHKVNGVKIAVPMEKMSIEDLNYVSDLIGEDLINSLDSTRKENAEIEKWTKFFKDCNIALTESQKYAVTFTKEKIDRDLLKSMDRDTFKTLGLVEGDVLRVMTGIKEGVLSKAPKAKRSVTFNPKTTIIDPSKDEELAYQLQQEEIERIRKEKGSGNLVEMQIEQDEMLARRLQNQNEKWEGFSTISPPTSENKKYGLNLSGGLGSKSSKISKNSIDQQKIAQASAFLESENQKENKNLSENDKKTLFESKSKKSGFDDEIWGVPGARATYEKKTPQIKQEEIKITSPNEKQISTSNSDPWANFGDSKPKTPTDTNIKPIFSSDKATRRDVKSKAISAVDQDWNSLSANFSKINNSTNNTVPKSISIPPNTTKNNTQDFAVFSKVQPASPRQPSTPQTAPVISTQPKFNPQPQLTPQLTVQKTPVILSQPLVPIPSNGASSNVFIPTRRPAPPKPTQNINVFGDSNIVSSNNSSNTTLPLSNKKSPLPLSPNNTNTTSNIFQTSNQNNNNSPNIFGSSTNPGNTNTTPIVNQNSNSNLNVFSSPPNSANKSTFVPSNSNPLNVPIFNNSSTNVKENINQNNQPTLNNNLLTQTKSDVNIGSQMSFNNPSDSLNKNFNNILNDTTNLASPIISERSFSSNYNANLNDNLSSLNSTSNFDISTLNIVNSSRSITLNSKSTSNYQFDDLSLKSLGINAKNKDDNPINSSQMTGNTNYSSYKSPLNSLNPNTNLANLDSINNLRSNTLPLNSDYIKNGSYSNSNISTTNNYNKNDLSLNSNINATSNYGRNDLALNNSYDLNGFASASNLNLNNNYGKSEVPAYNNSSLGNDLSLNSYTKNEIGLNNNSNTNNYSRSDLDLNRNLTSTNNFNRNDMNLNNNINSINNYNRNNDIGLNNNLSSINNSYNASDLSLNNNLNSLNNYSRSDISVNSNLNSANNYTRSDLSLNTSLNPINNYNGNNLNLNNNLNQSNSFTKSDGALNNFGLNNLNRNDQSLSNNMGLNNSYNNINLNANLGSANAYNRNDMPLNNNIGLNNSFNSNSLSSINNYNRNDINLNSNINSNNNYNINNMNLNNSLNSNNNFIRNNPPLNNLGLNNSLNSINSYKNDLNNNNLNSASNYGNNNLGSINNYNNNLASINNYNSSNLQSNNNINLNNNYGRNDLALNNNMNMNMNNQYSKNDLNLNNNLSNNLNSNNYGSNNYSLNNNLPPNNLSQNNSQGYNNYLPGYNNRNNRY